MSIDMAVWEGDRPLSHDEATRTFEDLYARYIDTDEPTEPTPRIREFVETLLARFPDLGETDDGDVPWAAGPLLDEASGPFIYFALVRNEHAEEAWALATTTAAALGLVAYDPQSGRLAEEW